MTAPKFRNLDDLDQEALRLIASGEMTEDRHRALLTAGLALGHDFAEMDFLVGCGEFAWFERLAKDRATTNPPAQPEGPAS